MSKRFTIIVPIKVESPDGLVLSYESRVAVIAPNGTVAADRFQAALERALAVRSPGDETPADAHHRGRG